MQDYQRRALLELEFSVDGELILDPEDGDDPYQAATLVCSRLLARAREVSEIRS